MSEALSVALIEGQQVELLPARTVLSSGGFGGLGLDLGGAGGLGGSGGAGGSGGDGGDISGTIAQVNVMGDNNIDTSGGDGGGGGDAEGGDGGVGDD